MWLLANRRESGGRGVWQVVDVIWSGAVWVCVVWCAVCLIMSNVVRWCNIGWLLQWFASSRGLVASFTWEYAAAPRDVLLSVSIRKPTLPPRGNWSIPSTQLEARAAVKSFPHFYTNAGVYYEISLDCNLSFLRPSLFLIWPLLTHPWWEQTVSLLNNSHHFYLILSYHGQFSSWIILWKIHLLSLCVMNLERRREEWWRILNCVCGARDPRVGNVF